MGVCDHRAVLVGVVEHQGLVPGAVLDVDGGHAAVSLGLLWAGCLCDGRVYRLLVVVGVKLPSTWKLLSIR